MKFLYRQFGAQKERARREPVRSPLRLSPAERKEISRDLQAGASFQALAARLNRSPSTISREVNANGGRLKYRAWRADERAVGRMARLRAPKLAGNARLRSEVVTELWSPQHISAHLKRSYHDDESMRISHETIYQGYLRPIMRPASRPARCWCWTTTWCTRATASRSSLPSGA